MKLRSILLAAAASLVTAVVVSQAQVPGVNSTLNTVFTLAYDNSTMKQTYSAAGVVTSTMTASGEICAISGSATKQIRVRRVIIGGALGAVETLPISIMKRSAVYTGVGAQPTKVPYDASNAAATAVVETWAAGGTAGTLVGMLADISVTFPGATTAIGNGAKEFVFGQLGQPIVLRSATQFLGVYMNGSTNAATIQCVFEWTEE